MCSRYSCIYTTYICIYGAHICWQQIHFFMCKQIIKIRIKNPLKFAMQTSQKQAENKPKTSQKLLHRTSPRCLCLCFRFYLISSASELTVRVCVSLCACVCVCVSVCVSVCACFHLSLTCWLCVASGSLAREFRLCSRSLCYSLSLSLLLAESVCVCVSGTDFSAEIFRRRLRLRLRHSSESNDRARLSPSRVSLSLVFIAFLSCKTLVKIRFTWELRNQKKNNNNNCEKREKWVSRRWQTWPNYLGNLQRDLWFICIDSPHNRNRLHWLFASEWVNDSRTNWPLLRLLLTRASFGHKFRVDSRSLPRNLCDFQISNTRIKAKVREKH